VKRERVNPSSPMLVLGSRAEGKKKKKMQKKHTFFIWEGIARLASQRC
jgi:hypothetical protein